LATNPTKDINIIKIINKITGVGLILSLGKITTRKTNPNTDVRI
jgi:hypothetical protein